jgi:hypothetical protein
MTTTEQTTAMAKRMSNFRVTADPYWMTTKRTGNGNGKKNERLLRHRRPTADPYRITTKQATAKVKSTAK